MLPKGAEDGYVYLARADTGHFKVGRSVDPEERIQHFDTQMPVEVSEWHFFRADDYVQAENALHELCDEHAEHVKGEWWDMPDYVVWWIKDIAYYESGEFHGGDPHTGLMEPPSESYGAYAKHFGNRTRRSAPPANVAFPRHG
jgi:hypothetical protein